jgi:methyltransferase FkbM-like protein
VLRSHVADRRSLDTTSEHEDRVRPVKTALKSALLPAPGARTLPLGIARGVRMRIDFRSMTRIYLGLYELELNRHLRRILKPGMTAFDVGAEHGYDALVIAKRTGAAVAAFECDPVCVDGIERSLALNPALAGHVRLVPAMVGEQPRQLALDAFAYGPDGFVPDFVKLDIEGGEAGALRSAGRLLSERRPALIVEVHSAALERECGRLLIEHGYAPTIVNQRSIWPDHRPRPNDGTGWGDVNRWLVAT